MNKDRLDRRRFMSAAGGALALALSQKADAAPENAPGEWRNKQPGMAYRRLGRTGFMVSEVVMGGVQIREDRWEHILPAIDLGLNYLDTAPAYGRGRSEKGYANVLRARPRDKYFLCTKVSVWDQTRNGLFQKIFDSLPETEQKKLRNKSMEEIERRQAEAPDYLCRYFGNQERELRASALSNVMAEKYGRDIDRKKNYRDVIFKSVEESLQRLGTDHVDILTCPHGASTAYEVLNFPEIFEAYEQLKRQGKVGYLSVSSHNDPAGVLEGAIKSGVYSMAMPAYNIVNQRYFGDLTEKAKKADFGIVAMKVARPVYNGRNNGTQDDPARVRLVEDAVPGDWNVPQKAYLWALRNPNLSAVVSDMANDDMVRENVPLAGAKPKG